MNVAKIRKMDISNGEGIRASLFVSGCTFYCPNCFNTEFQDFNYGKPFTMKTAEKLIELASQSHIKGITILGGEPLHENNRETVHAFIKLFKERLPEKTVWVYTGFTIDYFLRLSPHILEGIDVLVDGQFIDELKDYKLKFRGSSNQRLINVPETLIKDEIILKDL